jgi:TolB protein
MKVLAKTSVRSALLLTGIMLMFWSLTAKSILTIEITQGLDTGMPIAIVPFSWEGSAKPPQDVSEVVEADLARSGHFRMLPRKDFLSSPHEQKDVIFKDWRLLKAEALVIGKMRQIGTDKFRVEFRLYDVFKETQLAGYEFDVPASGLRMVAHQFSDIIFEKLTGEPGVFNTRIAYITKEGIPRRGVMYRLQVADSDGYNAKIIRSSSEPLMSPAWSPNGRSLSYVSFEKRRALLYVQNVLDPQGARDLIAEFNGSNSAPAWSPDGTRLALTLSKDGNAEIYVMRLADHSLTRITNNPAIDTEPAWSPDGQYLVFTSARSGGPQIFRVSAQGGTPQRLTFEGDYNARASYSPDGRMLTLITRAAGTYHTAVLDLKTSALQILTDTALDESPSFAPNGRIILYATIVQGRGVLASVSSDGRVRQLLKVQEGDVREPAWSPFNR